MAELKRIFLIVSTAQTSGADHDAPLYLSASRSGTDWEKECPNIPNVDERERGRTDYYEFDVRGAGILDNTQLTLKSTTADGWLPSSIWAIGETTSGSYVILAGNPDWTDWFDTDHPHQNRIRIN